MGDGEAEVFGVHMGDSTNNRSPGSPTAAASEQPSWDRLLSSFCHSRNSASAGLDSEHLRELKEVPGSAEHSSGFPNCASSAGV